MSVWNVESYLANLPWSPTNQEENTLFIRQLP